MSPASTVHESHPDPDTGLDMSLRLGSDYEKKKQKLLQELQLDYKDCVAKQGNLRTREPQVREQQGLSLPINERASIKGRLREERKKEYNVFLQEQAQKRRFKRGTPPTSSEALQGSPLPFLIAQTNSPPPPHKEHPASRRDAATLTEGGGYRRQRRWQIRKSEELEEETSTDEDEDFDFRYKRRHDRWTKVPEHKKKKTRKHRTNRAVQDLEEVKASVPHDPSNSDEILKSHRKEPPDDMRTAVRSTSVTRKDEAEFATGLLIGAAEDRTVTQMKKEQYKQELLRQIAEQKGNRIKEKRLELKVAATGATDPEKQQHENLRQDVPLRSGIHLDVVRKESNPSCGDEKPHENMSSRAPRGLSQVDFGSAFSQQPGNTGPGVRMWKSQGVAPFDYFNKDYHGDVTRTPEVAIPRGAPVLPPIIPDTMQAPYDASHHYGNRNPFDSHPPRHQSDLLYGAEQPGIFHITSQMQPLPVSVNEASRSAAEGLHVDRSKLRRESVLSYQEALKQQIKEREEQKRREEQEERCAKLEAAMMAYDPWGRSGAGAPIKDQHGNLVSDLKQMHRINNNKMSAATEAEAPLSHRRADSRHPSPSQQLSAQERYKEELKHQIEEQKRRQTEEREKIRIREEKEEEKLAKERARLQQQYEEEQRRQREAQENPQKKAHEAVTHHKVEVKRTPKQMAPQSAKEREEKTSQRTYETQQREPSPPIPTLQKKLLLPSRPSSETNQLSSRTGRSVSAPHVQRAASKVPTPYDGQQEVIRELSALRNRLRKKQNQLELQMDRTVADHSHLDRRQPRMDAFEFVKDESRHDSRRAEKQNQREFNHLKQGGELRVYQQGAPRPPEERWEMREQEFSVEERDQNHQPEPRPPRSPKATNQSELHDYNRSGKLRVLSARSARRRPISMETVSTEPRLHSGTSETVKHLTHRQKPSIRLGALPWLTQGVT